MTEYVADPSMVDVPLHLAEIEALAAAEGKPLRDGRKLQHFLQRTIATVTIHKQQLQQLHSDVRAIKLERERLGMATTLSPMDSVRYLSDEQLEQVFGKLARERLALLRKRVAEAEQAAAELANETARVRHATQALLDDPTVPEEVKARFRELLAAAPEPAVPEFEHLDEAVVLAPVMTVTPPAGVASAAGDATAAPRPSGGGWEAWSRGPQNA